VIGNDYPYRREWFGCADRRFLQNAGVTAMLRSGFAAIRLATLAINSPRSVRILRAMRPDVAEKINKSMYL
jgi:hypothetical protein